MIRIEREDYEVILFTPDASDIDSERYALDVEVVFSEHERYCATFLTKPILEERLNHYSTSGECLSGEYFWCTYPIYMKKMSVDGILRVIDDLIRNDEFKGAFERLVDD